MPQATNLTLKDAAAADCVFTLNAPSAGYGSVAEWQYKTGALSTGFPTITSSVSKDTGRDSRTLKLKIRVPYVDPTTGVLVGNLEFNASSVIPQSIPVAFRDDYAAWVKNALANTLINEQVKEAFPAT